MGNGCRVLGHGVKEESQLGESQTDSETFRVEAKMGQKATQ